MGDKTPLKAGEGEQLYFLQYQTISCEMSLERSCILTRNIETLRNGFYNIPGQNGGCKS